MTNPTTNSRNSKITTLDDDAPTPAVLQPTQAIDGSAANFAGLSGKRCTVMLHATSDKGGSEPALVGVNGYHWHIPRDGKPYSIPVEAMEVLQISQQAMYSADMERGQMAARDVQRFAFTAHA